ncbi:MAG: copper chaperone PCu(A)C [bacterium]|nr:copper chaperone PCu(A)C [bacterium]
MTLSRRVLLAALLSLAVCGCAGDDGGASAGEPLSVRDAWIREPPPCSPAAAYLTIVNRGASPIELVAVETAIAERTEIHVMEQNNGGMTMRRTESVSIPGHGEVSLRSGGTHLMLLNLRRQPLDGEVVDLVLRFGDGTEKRVEAPVRKG